MTEPVTIALIAAVPVLINFFIAFLIRQQSKKLESIHILVNSRMAQALADIVDLKKELEKFKPKPGD